MRSLENASMTEILPDSISDPKIRALCAALDVQLERLCADSQLVLHLPRLDDLSGRILDLLAWQFHVDNYSSLVLDDEQKRVRIRESIAFHRMKGTPAAVERVSADFGRKCNVVEWFDSGDEPGWFRVDIEPFDSDEEFATWMRAVWDAKNVRSWCKVRVDQQEASPWYFGAVHWLKGHCTLQAASFDEQVDNNFYTGGAFLLRGNYTLQAAT